MKKKSFAYPIIFMAVITAIFTFILAYLNHSTAEVIEFNQATELRQKILYVLELEHDGSPEAIEEVFNSNVEEVEVGENKDIVYKKIDENGDILAYAFPSRGAGLWGSIEAYIGITADMKEMTGIEFISQEETPGLGGRISEDFFKDQFRGLDLSTPVNDEYIIYRPANGGNVDAIAGATLTSKSVSQFMNEDIHEFITKGGIANE